MDLAQGWPEETDQFVKANQDQIIHIMSRLFELKQADLTKPVISKNVEWFV